mgnify:CR=1 FL=1
MQSYKVEQLGNLLNDLQLQQLIELANNKGISINQIKEIILQDDSKWKKYLIPDFFAYAILNEFNKRGME